MIAWPFSALWLTSLSSVILIFGCRFRACCFSSHHIGALHLRHFCALFSDPLSPVRNRRRRRFTSPITVSLIATFNMSSQDSDQPFTLSTMPARKHQVSRLNRMLSALGDMEQELNAANIKFPRFVACGDQSAGKSGVLRALSGVAGLKSGEGTCTRFPIAVTVITDVTNESFVAKILLSSETSSHSNLKGAVEDFNQVEWALKPNGAAAAYEAAVEILGVSRGGFSSHVLSFHYGDPRGNSMSYLDLPGLKHGSQADSDHLQELYERFMNVEENIVLAVIDCGKDLGYGMVEALVKRYNKESQAIAIVTKPDLLENSVKLEEDYLRAITEQAPGTSPYHLGWHLFRGLTPKEAAKNDIPDRAKLEADLFESGSFKLVPAEYKGLDTLKHRLQGIQENRLEAALPKVVMALDEIIAQKEGQLRQRSEEVARFRSELHGGSGAVQKVARVTRAAARGDFRDAVFPKDAAVAKKSSLPLMMRVDDVLATFAVKFRKEGHSWVLVDDDSENSTSVARVKRRPDLWEEAKEHCSAYVQDPSAVDVQLAGWLFREYAKLWPQIVADSVTAITDCVRRFFEELGTSLKLSDAGRQAMKDVIADPCVAAVQKCMGEITTGALEFLADPSTALTFSYDALASTRHAQSDLASALHTRFQRLGLGGSETAQYQTAYVAQVGFREALACMEVQYTVSRIPPLRPLIVTMLILVTCSTS